MCSIIVHENTNRPQPKAEESAVEDIELLPSTGERGPLMDRLRRVILAGDFFLAAADCFDKNAFAIAGSKRIYIDHLCDRQFDIDNLCDSKFENIY